MTSSIHIADIVLPVQFSIDFKQHGSPIQQIREKARPIQKALLYPLQGKLGWQTLVEGQPIMVFDRPRVIPEGVGAALRTVTGAFPRSEDELESLDARWLFPKASRAPEAGRAEAARASWENQFHFLEEVLNPDKSTLKRGLRPPQIGALYAALAHWTARDEAATIVMPTGTGKTETMLALCAQQRLERLLVVVPNDALRNQIGEKFLTWGYLKDFGILGADALYPVVCRLKHVPKNGSQVDQLFLPCNVVVTTMNILSGCEPDVLARIVRYCSHLFIDEAHHVRAASWDRVKHAFSAKRILQFTATPFREDKKHIGGNVIFNYPLHKAQEENYFKPITFKGVWSFDPAEADQLIAKAAVEALTADLNPAAGEIRPSYDHLVMARADSIPVAQQLHIIYSPQ